MNKNLEFEYNPINEFKDKVKKEDFADKSFYLTDYIIYRTEKDKNTILEELKRININIIRLKEYTKNSDESLFLRNEMTIYYFYLVNLELATILEKKNREKFMSIMLSDFYSILKFKDKNIEKGFTRVFNERFRYYDQFANNPKRTYEEKIENHNNIYAKFMIKKFWNLSEEPQLSLIFKSLAVQSLISFRLKEYFI